MENQVTRDRITIAAAIAVTLLAYAVGHAQGYNKGRCETFDAFVVASGFPLDMQDGYRPAECR